MYYKYIINKNYMDFNKNLTINEKFLIYFIDEKGVV